MPVDPFRGDQLRNHRQLHPTHWFIMELDALMAELSQEVTLWTALVQVLQWSILANTFAV